MWETDLQRVFQWDGDTTNTMGIQPGHVHAMMRSTRGKIYRSDSTDYGRSWCPAYATTLPNNNSGIDVVSFAQMVCWHWYITRIQATGVVVIPSLSVFHPIMAVLGLNHSIYSMGRANFHIRLYC